LTVWPPSSAAVCAEVGLAFSTGSLLVLPDFDEFEEEVEFPFSVFLPVNLSARLQSESVNARKSKRGICFIVKISGLPNWNLVERLKFLMSNS
jgi:hypothetical protein